MTDEDYSALIGRAASFEETDLPPLAADLGLSGDEVVLDTLRRAWRLGFYRAFVEIQARIIQAAEGSPR